MRQPRDRARHAVASATNDADELREMLDMLALWPEQDGDSLAPSIGELGHWNGNSVSRTDTTRARGYRRF